MFAVGVIIGAWLFGWSPYRDLLSWKVTCLAHRLANGQSARNDLPEVAIDDMTTDICLQPDGVLIGRTPEDTPDRGVHLASECVDLSRFRTGERYLVSYRRGRSVGGIVGASIVQD